MGHQLTFPCNLAAEVREQIGPGEIHLHLSPRPGWRYRVGLNCFSLLSSTFPLTCPKAALHLLLKVITVKEDL